MSMTAAAQILLENRATTRTWTSEDERSMK
jgi:hypothetical protein